MSTTLEEQINVLHMEQIPRNLGLGKYKNSLIEQEYH